MTEPVLIEADPTPNPNAFKFTLNRAVGSARGQTFNNPDEAAVSPLAELLFQVPGVRTLFFLKDFISVGRVPGADWDAIIARVEDAIRSFYDSQPWEGMTLSPTDSPS